jgi:hypothetical protein
VRHRSRALGGATARETIRLYRYIDRLEFADQFIHGQIWVTTLQTCREHEDVRRRDDEGASVLFEPGALRIDTRRAWDAEQMRGLVRGAGVTTVGTKFIRRVPDAYVLCLSRLCNRAIATRFGAPYVVRIDDAYRFIEQLTNSMQFAFGRDVHVLIGPVQYGTRERGWNDRERTSQHTAFTKPESFSIEAEYRVMWRPSPERPLLPRIFESPFAAKHCTLLSAPFAHEVHD